MTARGLRDSADIAEGQRVAEVVLRALPRPNGISTARGTPHIAGQRAAYLHLQLRAYQESARHRGAMAARCSFLSDDALVKVAAYYASLDPAAPRRRRRQAGPPTPTRCRPARRRRRPAPAAMARPASARSPERRAWSGSIRSTSSPP